VCLLRGMDWVFLKAQWLLYVPPGLTFTNSTYCPHSVFMCFVRISEQTAIISLYNINWLVFITETECVYCAIHAEYISIIQFRRLVAGLSPQRRGFDPRVSPCDISGGKVTLGLVFLRVLQFFLLSIIPQMLHIPLYLHAAPITTTNWPSLGTL
jgi:hypothetical protein